MSELLHRLRTKVAEVIAPSPAPTAPAKKSIGRGAQFPKWWAGMMRPLLDLFEQTAEENARRLKNSPWAYACVTAYCECLPSVDFVAQEWNAEEETWVRNRNHPVEERFDDPNPYQSQEDLVATNIIDMLTAGNALTSITDSKLERRDKVPVTNRLEALHADYVKPVVDLLDVFAGYVVQEQGFALVGRPAEGGIIPVRNMVHCRMPNPNDPLWGLAPIQVAAKTMEAEAAAIEWNKGLVENSAKSSMVFTTEMELERDQWQELVDRVIEAYTQSNVGTPMVLSHGLSAQKTSSDPVDLDFVNSAYLEATRTCAVLRVPPPVIGLTKDATLANLVEYYKQFWTTGIIPKIERLLGAYNRSWVWPRWKRGVRLWYDISNVAALQDNLSFTEKLAEAKQLVELGYTLNEANNRVGLGMPEIMLGNIRYQTPGLIPLFDESVTIQTGGDSEPEVDEEEKAAPYSEAGKKAYWKSFEERRERHYRDTEAQAAALMISDLRAFVNAARAGTDLKAVAKAREPIWREFIVKTWKEVGDDFYIRSSKEIAFQKRLRGKPERKDAFESFWQRATQRFVEAMVGKKIKSITNTTRQWVAGLVKVTIAEGLGLDTLANQLETLGPGYSKERAWTIARTEVIGASNYGHREGAIRDEFVTRKQWISSRDSRVRESHQDVDGQIQDLNKPYSNGLMFPGDPRGRASEVIKCRCVENYLID